VSIIEKPILLIGFNRPELMNHALESLLTSNRRIYLSIDGPRNHSDVSNVSAVNYLAKDFIRDRKSNTFLLSHKINLGCKVAVQKAIDWFFINEDCGIILEDDVIFDQRFLYFADEMLNTYKDCSKIFTISGNNFVKTYKPDQDTVFSRVPHIWGWATWKTKWDLYYPEIPEWDHKNWPNWFYELNIPLKHKNYISKLFRTSYLDKVNTWDYQLLYTSLRYDLLNVHPITNLNKNIGFNRNATHTKNFFNKPKFADNKEYFELFRNHTQDPVLTDNYDYHYLNSRLSIFNQLGSIFE
jgi:GR25 family glycosyltransferase involved in LPS biosynthesis